MKQRQPRPIYDFMVIGGGILGMSTAMQLQEAYAGCSVLVLEKEPVPAKHQTGRNSGVIHAGVYYKPGSLKARFCKEGNQATKAFCDTHGIKYDECGKLLVATDALELERMQALIDRCAQNELDIEVLDQQQLREHEPNISGVGAIFVPSTGIVNYAEITRKMAEIVQSNDGKILYDTEVNGVEQFADRVTAYGSDDRYHARYMVSCAGLHSDRIVQMLGKEPHFRIIPFRGEYYRLDQAYNEIVNHLIYPIPDPELPFLGVHLTRMIDGTVTVGPNAVLAFKREGYERNSFSLKESAEMLRYPGLIRLLRKHFRTSLNELKNSRSKSGYLQLVRKYCPSLTVGDLKPYPAGVRAQAVTKDGNLVDDFLFESTQRTLIVCNAPSPAATSAMPIGQHIVERLSRQVDDVY